MPAYCPPSVQACKTRTILTLQQAIQIFEIKLVHQDSRTLDSKCFTASAVARSFGVSEKAIRDIWRGRTWVRETMHLDPASAAAKAYRLRLPGRPRGHETKSRKCYPPTSDKLEYAAGTAATVAKERIQCMPLPVLSLKLPESSREDDPFHDDWPHWEAACQWEQRAVADGYLPSRVT